MLNSLIYKPAARNPLSEQYSLSLFNRSRLQLMLTLFAKAIMSLLRLAISLLLTVISQHVEEYNECIEVACAGRLCPRDALCRTVSRTLEEERAVKRSSAKLPRFSVMQILKNRIAAMKLPAAMGKRIQGFGILMPRRYSPVPALGIISGGALESSLI